MASSQLQARAMLNTGMTNNTDLNTQTKEQLDQLEFKVAFQEDTIEQLNQIVTQQQMAIDALEQKQQVIIEKLKSLQSTSSNINSGEEIPPHY